MGGALGDVYDAASWAVPIAKGLDTVGIGPKQGFQALSGQGTGGKGSGGPQTPDFAGAAQAQAASGHVNQTGPFGSTGWTQGPDGRWSQNTTLGAGLQQGVGNLEQQIGSQGPIGTGDQARDQAINATYGQMTSRLDPQWQQAEQAQQAQLANQGIDLGSGAYDTAMGNFNRAKNDAYQGAQNNAIQQGLAAQQATFGENLASQMAPYQQLGAINGLTSGLSGQGQQTQYLPAAMAAYQGDLQKYGIQQAGKNSMMGGLGGIMPMMGGMFGGGAGAGAGGASAAGVLI